MGIYSSAGRALQRKRRGHGFESRLSPEIPFFFFGLLRNCLNCNSTAHGHIEDLQLEGVKLELAQLKSELSEVKKNLDEKLDAVLAMLSGKDINE